MKFGFIPVLSFEHAVFVPVASFSWCLLPQNNMPHPSSITRCSDFDSGRITGESGCDDRIRRQHASFQTHAAQQMTSVLLFDVAQCVVVIHHRQPIGPICKSQNGTDRKSRKVAA